MSGDSDLPNYLRLANAIQQQIKLGELVAGDSLPSISSIASQEGVNRSTVKRAYDSLIDAGLVVSMQGKGYFVVIREEPRKPESSDLRVFWSYAHKDDQLSGGAITKLREMIQAEYELMTGNEANIFQDTKDISWGMDWRKAIDSALGVTSFFIPILTPAYLRSPYCLAELRTAKNRFEELGFPEGIYPIEFVNCSKNIEKLVDDDLANLLNDRQRIKNWIDLRSEDPNSSRYRKGVIEVVDALLKKEEQWTGIPAGIDRTNKPMNGEQGRGTSSAKDEEKPQPLTRAEPVDDSDAISAEMIRSIIDGRFEVITKSEIEESIPEITDGLSYMNDTFKLVDKDSQEVAGLLDNREVYENLNPETTLMLAELKANLLDAPVRRLQQHCSFYSEQTRLVDQGIDVLISQLGSLKDADAITYHVNMTLGPQIENLLSVNREYSSQIELMRSGLRDYSRLARVLREPCQQIEAALDNMESSATIIQSWKTRLEAESNITKTT